MEYISNAYLVQFVGDHWILILLVYGLLKAIFPNAQWLNRLAEKVSDLFPILKKKDGV